MANKNAKPPDNGFKDHPERINKKGAPKKPDLSEALNLLLSEEKDGVKALDAMLRTLRAKAIKGDIRAIQELLDRTYGKSKQISEIDHSGTLGITWSEEKTY